MPNASEVAVNITGPRDPRVRRLAGLVAYRVFSEVAGKGAFFVITLVAARRLSQIGFGVFSLGATVGWMAAVAADFGIQLHLARTVAQRPDERAGVLRATLGVRLWTAALAMAAVAAGLAIVDTPTGFAPPVALFTLVYLVNGLSEFLNYFYRGISRSDLESTLTLVQRAGTLTLALAVLWWRPSVAGLAVAMLVPATATCLYSLWLALRLASGKDTPGSARPGPPESRRALLRGIVPIGAAIVLSALYFRVDVFLIGALIDTRAVALYNAVFRLVEALRLLPAAALAVAMPILFQAESRRPLVALSAVLMGVASVVALVLWLSAGGLIPLLYGRGYADAVHSFRVLLLAFPLMSLNYALTHQLIGWHRHRTYAVLCGVALVFNVALNIRLIPALGIAGAAWTTVWTESLMTIGCLLALSRTRVRE